jgi:two-component system, NarL family, response regulator DesR
MTECELVLGRGGRSLPLEDRMPPSIRGRSLLTAEERAALSISATGLIPADVAVIMHAPPALVREWLASAVEKLGARSKLEAVVIAARRGELDVDP